MTGASGRGGGRGRPTRDATPGAGRHPRTGRAEPGARGAPAGCPLVWGTNEMPVHGDGRAEGDLSGGKASAPVPTNHGSPDEGQLGAHLHMCFSRSSSWKGTMGCGGRGQNGEPRQGAALSPCRPASLRHAQDTQDSPTNTGLQRHPQDERAQNVSKMKPYDGQKTRQAKAAYPQAGEAVSNGARNPKAAKGGSCEVLRARQTNTPKQVTSVSERAATAPTHGEPTGTQNYEHPNLAENKVSTADGQAESRRTY